MSLIDSVNGSGADRSAVFANVVILFNMMPDCFINCCINLIAPGVSLL